MNNYEKFGWISGQVLVGIGFGMAGSFLSLVMDALTNADADLDSVWLYALTGFYPGFLVGVCFDGNKMLMKFGQEKRLFRQCCFCLAGTLLGFAPFTFIYFGMDLIKPGLGLTITMVYLSYALVLLPILPFIGAVAGFNYSLHILDRPSK